MEREMAGRFAHFLIAGGAIVGGMIYQGDLELDVGSADHKVVKVRHGGDGATIDRQGAGAEVRGKDGQAMASDPATRRALSEAVAELVRAEGSLVAARLDDETPAAAIRQAERRRDLARQSVDRLAEAASTETRGDRDDLRRTIRDEIRQGLRESVGG
jgi:hypothetical protein